MVHMIDYTKYICMCTLQLIRIKLKKYCNTKLGKGVGLMFSSTIIHAAVMN